MILRGLLYVFCCFTLGAGQPSPRDALQPFNELIGSWRATGTPVGTREEQQKGFWTETLTWEWQFKGSDAWLKVDFDKGKYFTQGELRHDPDSGPFVLRLTTVDKQQHTFVGSLKEKTLTLQRNTEAESQKLVFSFLHDNRFLYRYEVKPKDRPLVQKRYTVGATKEGVAFATGDGKPECIVSGGLGSMAVMYQGKTYYVCCSGCRTEFLENPQKYIEEASSKKTKAKK